MAKPELRDHRKFLKLCRILQAPAPHVLGYLDYLWHRGYQTGNPFIGDSDDVEAAACFVGDRGSFTRAAVEAGFIDVDESGRHVIHDLYEHAPKYAKMRMDRAGFGLKPAQTGHDRAKNGTFVPVTVTDVTRNGTDVPGTVPPNPKPKPKPKPKPNPKTSDAPASVDVERPRDLLFDAIAEVTASDPATAGSHVAAVKKAMLTANPPYTPDEVREFGRRYQELCTWGPRDGRCRPELGELQKHIGKIRAAPIAILDTAKPPPKSFSEQKTARANALLEAMTEKPKPALAEGESRVA